MISVAEILHDLLQMLVTLIDVLLGSSDLHDVVSIGNSRENDLHLIKSISDLSDGLPFGSYDAAVMSLLDDYVFFLLVLQFGDLFFQFFFCTLDALFAAFDSDQAALVYVYHDACFFFQTIHCKRNNELQISMIRLG